MVSTVRIRTEASACMRGARNSYILSPGSLSASKPLCPSIIYGKPFRKRCKFPKRLFLFRVPSPKRCPALFRPSIFYSLATLGWEVGRCFVLFLVLPNKEGTSRTQKQSLLWLCRGAVYLCLDFFEIKLIKFCLSLPWASPALPTAPATCFGSRYIPR